MQEVTDLKNDTNEIKTFLNPRYVFLPIKKGYRLKVKDGDYVYKNDIVAMNHMGMMAFSSCSGRVLGVKDMPYLCGIMPSLVIENDFKENIRVRKSARKYISNMTPEEFFSSLVDTSLSYRGANIPVLFKKGNDELIINGIDREVEFKNKYYILKNHIEDILETIDKIGSIIGAKRIVFTLKNSMSDIINSVVSSIGTYPNIEVKLLSDDYVNGLDEVIQKNLNMPSALVLDIGCVYKIYETLKREVSPTEKIITICGPGVKGESLIKVKLGSLLSEVFVSNYDFASKNVDVYLNGPIGGDKVTSMKIVIDDFVEGIYVEEESKHVSETCINCGMCSKCCPVGLNPKYVFDHKGRVKKEYYDKCIQCGLCNHVCPSNIDLAKYMRRP